MKHRTFAYAGVVLGVVALASSFVEPMAAAKGNSGRTATATVTCPITGDLFVHYSYSGFPGGASGVNFVVGANAGTVVALKGGSGTVVQAFNQSLGGVPVDWGTVGAQLVDHNGKVIKGSFAAANLGNPVTC